MYIFLGIAALVLILPLLGMFPAVKWHGSQSANNMFKIEMHPPEYYPKTNQSMIGVYAQERVEFWMRWVVLMTLMGAALRAGLEFDDTGVGYAGVLVGFFVGMLLVKTPAYFRQSELIGHGVEVLVASRNGFDFDAYLFEEADRTVNSSAYRGVFKGYTVGKFADEMEARMGLIRFLVALHTVALKRMKKD